MDMANIDYEPWRAVRRIGSGSFGAVYEIQREEFGAVYKAALKVISIPKTEDEIRENRADGMDEQSMTSYYNSVVQELTHEFSLLSKLAGNTNVVSYADHKVVPHANGIGWDIYIRMELLTSLTTISSAYNFTRDEVLKLGVDICDALILCEKQNIIHRDIKPDNIFVSDNGDFKLGDFGIARTASKTMSNMSKRGTLNYMAPEVSKNEPYNHTADIYSLGIVLYQLMNNKRLPFIPQNMTIQDREAALGRRMSGEALPMPETADKDFARIILKACAYNPNQRYMDAEEMKKDLLELLNRDLPKVLDMNRIMGFVQQASEHASGSEKLVAASSFGGQQISSQGVMDGSQNFGQNSAGYGYSNQGNNQNNGMGTNGNMFQNTVNPSNISGTMNGERNDQPIGNDLSQGTDDKKKLPFIIGGAGAAVMLIIVLVVALTSRGKKSETVAVEQPVPTVETVQEEVTEEPDATEEVESSNAPAGESVDDQAESTEVNNEFDDSAFGLSSRFDKNQMTGIEAAELKLVGSFQSNADFPMYQDNGLYVQTGSHYTIYNYKGEEIEGQYVGIEKLNSSLINEDFYVVSAVTDDLPKKGIIKADGTEVISCEAADIKEINDYYVLLTYLDKETEKQSEANIVMGSGIRLGNEVREGDRFFVGHYALYNLYTGKVYENIESSSSVEACGDSIILTLKNDTKQIIDSEDKVLVEKANMYINHGNCFSLTKQSGKQEVYDSNMNHLFTLEKGQDIFSTSDKTQQFFVIREHSDEKSIKKIFDKSGETVLSFSDKDGMIEIENDYFGTLCKEMDDGSSKYAFVNLHTKEKTDYVYEYVDSESTYAFGYTKQEDGTYQFILTVGDTVVMKDVSLKEQPRKEEFKFIGADSNQIFILQDKNFTGPNVEDSYSEINYLKNGLLTMQDAAAKYGVIDMVSGKQLLDYEYDEIGSVYGYIYAKKGDVWEVYKIKSSFR